MLNEKRAEVQRQAVSTYIAYGRSACLCISGGVGKTKIGLDIAQEKQCTRVLIAAPKVAIQKSWSDDIEKFGVNLTPVFTTYLSLKKHNPDDYEFIILDEISSLQPHHEEWLIRAGCKLLSLTGTMPPKYSDKGKLIAKYCPVIFEYKTDEAVEDEILNDYKIIVHGIIPSEARTIQVAKKLGGYFFTSEVAQIGYYAHDYQNEIDGRERMAERLRNSYEPGYNDPHWNILNPLQRDELRMILQGKVKSSFAKESELARKLMSSMMKCPSKEAYVKKLLSTITNKCIVFANSTEQADRLAPHTYHSKNKNSELSLELFKSGDTKVLGTVNQLEMGITIPELREGIVIHAFGSNIRLSQRFFRLLRLSPEDKATLHVLMFKGTRDEFWVRRALANLDQNKIRFV